MKKIIIIIVLFVCSLSFKAQDYYMNTSNSQTITTCKGNVFPAWGVCSAFGYASYCNNENYTVTFYSGNPLIPLKLSFLRLNLAGFPTTDVIYTEAGYDFLTIINGPSIGSPTLATISGVVTNPLSYQSTGAYLTINFKSDGSSTDWGWFGIIGCQPQNCNGNLPASDVCASAVPICDLNGYCGSTNGWYTPDNENIGVAYGGTFCGASGSIENNSWIKFIPSAATANINISVQNCSSATQGLQAGLFSTPNCSAFTLLTCQSQATYAPIMTLSYNSFVPGNTYYIMIDGFAGNACNYTVSASSGVAISTVNVSSNAICNGQTTNLTAVAAGITPSYTWSTGSNAASISVSPTLITAYTATIASGFCTEIITKTITVNPLPVANAGTSPASITCASQNQALGGSGGGTYVWSGTGIVSGGTSASPTVNGPGPFSLTVTSAAGCTSTNVATVSVPVNTVLPIPAITSATVLNCSNPSINLTGTPASGVTYVWTGPGIVSGGTSATPLVNTGGTYNMTVTSTVNGCSSSTNLAIAAINNSIVVAPATTGSVTCANNIINLTTTSVAGQNYTWTAPGGAAITSSPFSATATGSNSGTYSVTVFNSTNGCSQVGTIAAVVNTIQGVPSVATTGTVTCVNNAINLNTGATGVTYTWVPPAGSSISSNGNTANASGNGPGTYSIIVTNTINGCTNSNAIAVTTQTVKPTAVINTTPVITCLNPTVTINGSPATGVTYTWSGVSVVGGTNTPNANVSATGLYSLAVTSTSNGCVSTTPATVNITSNLTTPAITALGSQTANSGCGTSSLVTLSGTATPAGSTYTWTSSGGFASGVNNSTVIVNGSTTYTLNSTHPVTGCISSLVYTVNPSVNQPTLTVSSVSGTVTCANTVQSTTVTSNPASGVTYAWTGPGIVGTNTASAVTGSLAGVYNLTVTNTSNNCNSTASYILSADNAAIIPNATTSNSVNCNVTTATIVTAPTPTSSSFTYSWSTGATSSSVSVNPTVNTNYVVTVTNTANGCTGSQTVNVVANIIAPTAVSISPNNIVLACPAQTANLIGSATGAVSYTWIAPAGGNILSSPFSPTVQVSSSSVGTFSLITAGANGCSAAAATATVSPNTNAPTFTLSNANPSITCLTSSPNVTVGLTSTVSIQSYSWSPGSGISGPTNTSVVTFTAAGTYTGVITASNGCISTTTVSVANATLAPTVVAGTGTAQTISCTNTIVTIAPTFTPSANLTYTWSGPGIVGSSNNSSVQVNQNGSYSLTVTNSLTGCSSASITVPVVGTNVPPTLNVSSSSSIGISCQPNTNTVSLTASSSGAVTYSWSSGSTSSVINTANAGVYTVTVVDINSNCSASQTIAVTNNTITPSFTASAAGSLPCGAAGTTTLNAIASNTNVTYNWSGPAVTNGSNTANAEVSGAGVYTVLVTDNITGCSSTQTVSVNSTTVNAAFNPDATIGAPPLTVVFTNQSTGAITYSWSFGNGTSTQTNPTNVFSSPGTYTVVLVSMNGACTSTAEVVIKVNEKIGTVPEVFTPNGDGHNDVFEIKGLDSYPNNSLQIFNRWGNPVYFAKPYKNDWDGTPNTVGKTGTSKLPTATYFYILDLGDDDKTILRGFIQLQY